MHTCENQNPTPMKRIILSLILAFVVVGCGRKEPASSEIREPEAKPANQTGASGVAMVQDFVGKWMGVWETKVPKEVTEKMAITFSKENGQWKGECRFSLYGNSSSNTREVSVERDRISFRCDLGSHSEFRFSGQLTSGQITGTLEIFEHDQKVATGTWTVTRARE